MKNLRPPKINLKVSTRKKDLLDKIVSRIQRSRPKGEDNGTFDVCRTNKSILSEVKYTLKTGIDSFDDEVGGFPFGRVVEIYGLDQSGKTALVMRACVCAQTKKIYELVKDPATGKVRCVLLEDDYDVTALFIDNEQSMNSDEKIIIDGQEIDGVLARCDTVDQIFKIVDLTIDETVEYEKETGRRQFVVVIVDTIAGTASKEELTAEFGTQDYPRSPKQLRQGFRVMARKINRHNVCMICTNQVSGKFTQGSGTGGRKSMSNTPQDSDFEATGGRALKYYASVRVFLYRLPYKYVLVPGAKFQAGYLIGFYTSKNRVIKPLREGRMVLLFDGGYSNVFSRLETLLFLKFAEMNDSGDITFRFKRNKIKTTTFESKVQDDKKPKPRRRALVLDEGLNEEEESGMADPSIIMRSEWPGFYAAHKVDLDILWDKAMEFVFTTEGLGGDAQQNLSSIEDIDVPEDLNDMERQDEVLETPGLAELEA